MQNQIGKVLKSYELEGLVGTGGFGAVYRARQAVVEREVAIKIIWPAFANHPNFIRRFEAEAQLVAGLEHPHIVPLYDYWRDPDGAYIVMRYLRGGALREIMGDHDWSLRDINRLLSQVGSALALAHRYGVVHRDIKPENILLDEDGNVYLADFGIAQIVSNAQEDAGDAMMAGMGSPAYAAPEQVTGGFTSTQSDLYSLGVILYELITGEHPFPELDQLSITEMNDLRATRSLPRLTDQRKDMSASVDQVIQKATALDPKNRYPDALSFVRAFQEAAGSGARLFGSQTRTITADTVIPNPYKGLRPFQEADAENFFGREALVQRLVNRLKEADDFARFLAVVGPSGSGKSSMVKAGLIPSLRRGAIDGSRDWFYDEIVPGAMPFDEIERALVSLAVDPAENIAARLREDHTAFHTIVDEVLPPDETEFVLFIDQFEEVFTLVEDEQLITHFLKSLHHAVTIPESRVRVIITIRADFYDRPLLQPGLSDMVRERTEVVVPLSPSELERVIIEPARRVGVMIDSGLVAAIIADVKEQPGALPLLQYTLSELFDRREGNLITPAAYRELGGVRGALAKRADELFNELDNDEKIAVRQLMLRLITLGEGTEDTRRRALLSEVTSIRDDDDATDDVRIMNRVIDKFGKARLLTFDRDPITRSPTVEVTHEAIIREWARLRTWLDESRNDVRMQRSLSNLAQEWEQNSKDVSFLLRGVRLDSYEKWVESTAINLTRRENDYLNASIQERQARIREERERQEREEELERRSVQRLQLLAVFAVIAAIVAGGLATFGFQQSIAAERAQENAEANARLSQSIAWEASARQALGDYDSDLAIMLALQANSIENPPLEALSTLSDVAFSPGTRQVLRGHDAWVQAVDINPDSTRVISGSTDATVKIWDVETGAILHDLDAHGGDIESVTFAPDGDFALSAATDFVAILWDVETGEEVQRFVGHQGPVRDADFTPDGTQIATVSSDGLVILWDVATGEIIRRFEGHAPATVLTVALNSDASRMLSGSRDGRLLLWDVNTGALLREFGADNLLQRSAINSINFSHDDQYALSAEGDGNIHIWDVATGEIIQTFVGITEDMREAVFNADSSRVYSASINGLIQIWDVQTGLELNRLEGHGSDVLSLAINDNGRLLVSGSKDDQIRVWNIGQPGAERVFSGHESRVTSVVAGRSGNIYTTSTDDTIRVWNPETGDELASYNLGFPLLALSVAPDEATALIGSRDGVLVELDLETGDERQRLVGHSERIETVVYTSDGTRALSGGFGDVIILWDVATGEVIRRFEGHSDSIFDISITPDDTRFVSASADSTLRLWDIETGDLLREFTNHEEPVYTVDVHPNGQNFASGSRDGFIIVWDIDSGDEVARLVGDTETVWTVSYSPSGARLVSGSEDGVVIVWNTVQNLEFERFVLGDVRVFGSTFTADGRNAITAQEDTTIYVWRTYNAQSLTEWVLDNRYISEWTQIECERFRIDPCELVVR